MSAEPTRNLVIVHTPDWQALSDWTTVKQKIETKAPDIEVRIANNWIPNSATQRWQTRRPSLVFSVAPLFRYRPAGGTVYAGRKLNKLKQYERLAAAGVPAPEAILLRAGLDLDPAVWGDYVIVKPSGLGSSSGQYVRLVRTETVGRRFSELTLNKQLPMLVQRFVDASDESGCRYEYRVLTLFGRPIYQLAVIEREPRPPLAEVAETDQGAFAINRRGLGNKRELRLMVVEDILEVAKEAARAISEFPCLGIDLVRDRTTGQVYVLETNPGGETWHISSRISQKYPAEVREGIYTQFAALDTAADALIEKTRAEAS